MQVVRTGFALTVAIALAGCGSGGTAATSAPTAASTAAPACEQTTLTGVVDVEIKDFAFKPDPVQAKVGQTINWTNNDSIPHSAALDGGLCATDTIGVGEVGTLKFSIPGTYAYHCAIHPTQMKGTIVVSG